MTKSERILVGQDSTLKPVIENTKLRPIKSDGDVYLALIRAIVSQQLSVKAADTIYNRFLDLFPKRYPGISQLIKIEATELRAAGLSKQKSGYVKNVATFAKARKIQKIEWKSISDEEIVKMLTEIKGVGEWTVQMVLMFTLKRPDVLPLADLAIQQKMTKLYDLSSEKKILLNEMKIIAEKWRPYRSLACRYLWSWHPD